MSTDYAQIPAIVTDKIDKLIDVCRIPKTSDGGGWRNREKALQGVLCSIILMIKDFEGRIENEYDAALKVAASICRQIGSRGNVCEDPDVFSALHESEAKACEVAIMAETFEACDSKPRQV